MITISKTVFTPYQQPNVYVVRHGETCWNVLNRIQGHNNESQLTHLGESQAEAVAEHLRPHFKEEVEIWSSDLIRAHNTAKIIARTLGVSEEKIYLEPLLREAKFGRFEGAVPTCYQSDPDFLRYKKDQFHNAMDPVNGESYQTVAERVLQAIVRIAEQSKEKNILIVTHGGAIRSIQMVHLPASGDPAQYGEIPDAKNGEIYTFDKPSRSLIANAHRV